MVSLKYYSFIMILYIRYMYQDLMILSILFNFFVSYFVSVRQQEEEGNKQDTLLSQSYPFSCALNKNWEQESVIYLNTFINFSW